MLGDRRKKSRPRAAMAMAGGLVALVLGAVPAQAATINVTPGLVNSPPDDGRCSLIEAINAANADTATGDCPAGPGADTINAPGTFVLTDDPDLDGNGLPVITSTMTIRSATIQRSSAPATPDFRIFAVASTGDLTLEAVTVSGGRVSCSGDGCSTAGAGIFNFFGTLTLQNSQVVNNTASCSGERCAARGGGINDIGTLTVRSSQVRNNTASCLGTDCFAIGGGIDNGFRTATLTNNAVTGNRAIASCVSGCAANGGGIANIDAPGRGATLTVSGNSVTDNTASCSGVSCAARGGGIANRGTLTVTSSRLSNNTASCSGTGCTARGGGLFNFAGTATLNGSAVTDNLATATGGGTTGDGTADGGGIFEAGGDVVLNNSFVSGNTPNNCRPVGSVDGCTN